jgi:hypothetical protein
MTTAPLHLTRDQVLAHRRRACRLDERLPGGPASLRRAAWAGLSDSMPRGAVLALHARVEGVTASAWEDEAFVQVWGPRFSAYVVPAEDRAVFTLGRLPASAARAREFEAVADRLEAFLAGGRMPYGEAGHRLGVPPNSLRYAAPTGRVLIRWDGARQPVIWAVPRPGMDAGDARAELARRYLHVQGPGTADGFGDWAGIRAANARATFDRLAGSLQAVRTPVGDGWILAADEASFRAPAGPPATARLLPSGDVYWLLQGAQRELLVQDPAHRPLLWTPRVWPGAILVRGEIAGTWRRAGRIVDLEAWRPLDGAERAAVEAEAASFPIPEAVGSGIAARWGG